MPNDEIEQAIATLRDAKHSAGNAAGRLSDSRGDEQQATNAAGRAQDRARELLTEIGNLQQSIAEVAMSIDDAHDELTEDALNAMEIAIDILESAEEPGRDAGRVNVGGEVYSVRLIPESVAAEHSASAGVLSIPEDEDMAAMRWILETAYGEIQHDYERASGDPKSDEDHTVRRGSLCQELLGQLNAQGE